MGLMLSCGQIKTLNRDSSIERFLSVTHCANSGPLNRGPFFLQSRGVQATAVVRCHRITKGFGHIDQDEAALAQ